MSTQAAWAFHCAHKEFAKEDPVDRPVHHLPSSCSRPMMSILPSPLKSPTRTSAQVAWGFHWVQKAFVKEEPVDKATHHFPSPNSRPTKSVLPSPLKSP